MVGDWTPQSGAAARYRLLDQLATPKPVFCANDLMAIGALEAALEPGLSVPGDMAIMGVEDSDAASLVRSSLTTVRVPAQNIGSVAGNLSLRRIAKEQSISHRDPNSSFPHLSRVDVRHE